MRMPSFRQKVQRSFPRKWEPLSKSTALGMTCHRSADRQVLPILYIPYDTRRPQVRPQLEDIPGMLHDLRRYSSRRRCWWSALRKPRHTVPFPHPLNGPCTGSIGPELLLYLIGTMGGIALARRDDLLLPCITEPVIGPLWPGRMILEGFAHRRQRARAKFVGPTGGKLRQDLTGTYKAQ
jgi:hypothetical protein